MQDLIANDAQGPDVDCISVIMKFSLFGRNVLFCSCNGLHDDFLCTEAKIGQLYSRQGLVLSVFGFKEDILWF